LAATITRVVGSENVVGKLRAVAFDITGDSSYPAGGYAVTAATLGLRNILGMEFIAGNTAGIATTPYYNSQTGKVMFEVGGADETATTNVSTFTYRAIVYSLDN
jgi:hypothetical protein